jgi:hypothetical protein
MEGVGIFYGHLVYFTTVCYFYTHLVYFGTFYRFGMLHKEKSGNPETVIAGAQKNVSHSRKKLLFWPKRCKLC